MTRRSGRPRFSAIHSGVAMSSGRAVPAKGGLRGVTDRGAKGATYDRPVVSPFMPDPEKVAAIRTMLPATGAGIYLNAGSAGPMPTETHRAMDEQAARELAVGRASPDGFVWIQERWAELRASV